MVDRKDDVFKITKSLSQPIYDFLKKAIINNELKVNEKIDEKEIAEKFGVSRTPVREAIIRLSVEGFVDIRYHRDSVVKEIPYGELEEILQVISCLDAYAIKLIADEISAKDIAQIGNLTSKMGNFFDAENTRKYFDTNFSLHEIIWNYLPEGFLRSTLEAGAAQIQRYTINPCISKARTMKGIEASLASHKKIVKALKARDKEKLSFLFGQHWIHSRWDFLDSTE